MNVTNSHPGNDEVGIRNVLCNRRPFTASAAPVGSKDSGSTSQFEVSNQSGENLLGTIRNVVNRRMPQLILSDNACSVYNIMLNVEH